MRQLTKHLSETNMTYFQHMRRATGISLSLSIAAISCMIHGFFPFMFETKASDLIKDLVRRI